MKDFYFVDLGFSAHCMTPRTNKAYYMLLQWLTSIFSHDAFGLIRFRF